MDESPKAPIEDKKVEKAQCPSGDACVEAELVVPVQASANKKIPLLKKKVFEVPLIILLVLVGAATYFWLMTLVVGVAGH